MGSLLRLIQFAPLDGATFMSPWAMPWVYLSLILVFVSSYAAGMMLLMIQFAWLCPSNYSNLAKSASDIPNAFKMPRKVPALRRPLGIVVSSPECPITRICFSPP